MLFSFTGYLAIISIIIFVYSALKQKYKWFYHLLFLLLVEFILYIFSYEYLVYYTDKEKSNKILKQDEKIYLLENFSDNHAGALVARHYTKYLEKESRLLLGGTEQLKKVNMLEKENKLKYVESFSVHWIGFMTTGSVFNYDVFEDEKKQQYIMLQKSAELE